MMVERSNTLSLERRTGVIPIQKLRELGYVPSGDRLRRGAVAIFECIEPIPCNVCVFACPFKAVEMSKITDLPKVDFSKCTGCALCVAQCPGQAIRVVDLSGEEGSASVILQYDLTKPPIKGDSVALLNEYGEEIGVGEVELTYKHKRSEAYVIKVKVPKELALTTRGIRVKGE